MDRPEPIKVEDDTVKEYFLNQYRNTFNKKLDENKRNSSSYDVALRRTLREVIAISNSLFDAVFDVEGSEDIFKRLVDKENPSEDFERAKNKFQVSKVIRETKEVDYQSAIRLEKRLLKEMEKANNKLIRENIKARSSETRKTYLAKLERQMRLYQKEKIKIKDQLTAITDKKMLCERKETSSKRVERFIRKDQKQKLAFEKAEKTRLETQLKKIEERKRARVKKALANKLAKEKAAKERLAKKLAKEKEKAALALQAFKEKQKAKSKEKISKAKAKSEEKIKAIEQLSTTSEFVNTPEVKDDNNA